MRRHSGAVSIFFAGAAAQRSPARTLCRIDRRFPKQSYRSMRMRRRFYAVRFSSLSPLPAYPNSIVLFSLSLGRPVPAEALSCGCGLVKQARLSPLAKTNIVQYKPGPREPVFSRRGYKSKVQKRAQRKARYYSGCYKQYFS